MRHKKIEKAKYIKKIEKLNTYLGPIYVSP